MTRGTMLDALIAEMAGTTVIENLAGLADQILAAARARGLPRITRAEVAVALRRLRRNDRLERPADKKRHGNKLAHPERSELLEASRHRERMNALEDTALRMAIVGALEEAGGALECSNVQELAIRLAKKFGEIPLATAERIQRRLMEMRAADGVNFIKERRGRAAAITAVALKDRERCALPPRQQGKTATKISDAERVTLKKSIIAELRDRGGVTVNLLKFARLVKERFAPEATVWTIMGAIYALEDDGAIQIIPVVGGCKMELREAEKPPAETTEAPAPEVQASVKEPPLPSRAELVRRLEATRADIEAIRVAHARLPELMNRERRLVRAIERYDEAFRLVEEET